MAAALTAIKIVQGALGFYGVDAKGLVVAGPYDAETADAYADALTEGQACSMCDGLGHGYPGGPPCPLENSLPFEEAEMDLYPERFGLCGCVRECRCGEMF